MQRDVKDAEAHKKMDSYKLPNRTSNESGGSESTAHTKQFQAPVADNLERVADSQLNPPAAYQKLDLRPITIPLATNVNNRLKKYANYVFQSCKTAKETGK